VSEFGTPGSYISMAKRATRQGGAALFRSGYCGDSIDITLQCTPDLPVDPRVMGSSRSWGSESPTVEVPSNGIFHKVLLAGINWESRL
jgi:hypothetical protein